MGLRSNLRFVVRDWQTRFQRMGNWARILRSRSNGGRIDFEEFTMKLSTCIALLLVLLTAAPAFAQLPSAAPAAAGMSQTQLAHIDAAVTAEIAKKQLPGAVVLVGRQGKVVWRRAYGNRTLEPQIEPMTPDTIFDLASLTKILS